MSVVGKDVHRKPDTAGEGSKALLPRHCMIIGKREKKQDPRGTMKKICQGAVLFGALLLLTGCASGTVVDKRAAGEPGSKVFQLRIDGPIVEYWVTVSEKEWDRCGMYTDYRACVG